MRICSITPVQNMPLGRHDLEVYLVRLLFCMFADDTGIFNNKGIFWEYIDLHTKENGSDLAMHIASIFHILNTSNEKRLKNLDENLAQFPYVNGKLFEETVKPATFDKPMREMLLKACAFDWGKISPAIFGSMFQAVMNQTERRNLGAHYTSEKNIQKLIKPLFLDDLYTEFEKAKGSKGKLETLHKKIANLHFLDPACGCGNFLIITYRELRDLEILILLELNKSGQLVTDISSIIQVDVDQFAGIEYDEFAVRVAEVAMWLIDHQMNLKVSNEFGQYFVRLPLKKAAKIVHGNSLRIDWGDVVAKEKLNFILGNPPFVGKHLQSRNQKEDMQLVFDYMKGLSDLDYVTAWFYKAASIIKNTRVEVGFVATSSITQGEQVYLLWNSLINDFGVKINFVHRTFKWSNEAKGNAVVHCVIIGFSLFERPRKEIFDYESINSDPQKIIVEKINPYLNSGSLVLISKRSKPLSNVSPITCGNKPSDDGNFIFSDVEKNEFVKKEPLAHSFFRKYIGSAELINNTFRWCLWLKDIPPVELKKMPLVLEKIDKVRKFRENSTAAPTRKTALTPSLFFYISQPDTNYLAIPEVSSERRKYIPIGFLDKSIIASNKLQIIHNANLYLFGILTSEMHMTWVRYVCGRLKSDFDYSSTIVYNNYPFPENVSDKQKQKVETAAQKVLDTRAKYPDISLADLYDPLTMPPDLVKAHQALDKAVDLCYRPQPFVSELNRIEYLFSLYEAISVPLLKVEKKKRSQKKDS